MINILRALRRRLKLYLVIRRTVKELSRLACRYEPRLLILPEEHGMPRINISKIPPREILIDGAFLAERNNIRFDEKG